MEVNKDEALRCVEVARKYYNSGDYERAKKFISKSLGMFPTGTSELEHMTDVEVISTSALLLSVGKSSSIFVLSTGADEARALAVKVEAAQAGGATAKPTSSQVRLHADHAAGEHVSCQ
jgi:DnaJ family protein B protein 12